MDKITHEVRLANWTSIIQECENRPQGVSKSCWLKENRIYENWQAAERAIRDTYHTVKHTFQILLPGLSDRVVDGYNEASKTIYEVKYGYAALTNSFSQK